MASDEKENVAPMVAELKAMVDNLDERIASLARECPTEWGDEKSNIDEKMLQVSQKWKEVWGAMGDTEYGIGGA